MGYDLHITRADDWTGSKDFPIPADDWARVVNADPTLAVNEADSYSRKTPHGGKETFHPVEWSGHPDDSDVVFWFMDGEVTSKNPDEPTVLKMVELARKLEARVLGDDGEHYNTDVKGVLTIDGEPSRPSATTPEAPPSSPPYLFIGAVVALIAAAVVWWLRR